MPSETAAFPDELTALRQWVVWRVEVRDGRPTKVPYDPHTGRHASTTDPNTWGTFADACQTNATSSYGGLGFVITQDGPYTGIDLDGCRNLETGRVEPWAAEIIRQIDSYTECSASGRGIHILARAKLRAAGRRREHVEMYDSGRFFTMSGRRQDDWPSAINARQLELDALHASVFGMPSKPSPNGKVGPVEPTNLDDTRILQLGREAKNGNKFSALWNGDWAWAGYESQSEADEALSCMLAFYTGHDLAQMDRLFRCSGLYRPKWDERHYSDGKTYGEVTLVKATGISSETYSPPGVIIHTNRPVTEATPGSAPESDGEIPSGNENSRYILHHASEALGPQFPIAWVVERLFSAGSVSLIVGEGGSKKTYSILDCAICVALGEPWLNLETTPSTVLIIDEESGNRRLKRRLGEVMRGHGADEQTPLWYTTLAQFNLRDGDDVGHVTLLVERLKPCLVIIDALVDVMPGGDENAVKDVHPVFQALRAIAEKYQTAIVVIHHSNKGGKYRGSTAMRGAVDLLLMVESKKEEATVLFTTEKVRDTEPFSFAALAKFDPVAMTMSLIPSGPRPLVERFSKSETYVVEYLREHGPSQMADIEANATCGRKAARNAVYTLVTRHAARRTDKGGIGERATYELCPIPGGYEE